MIPILNAIISILYVFIWIYIYLYITKLEKIGCECSNDWKRSYIKYYILIILLFIILRLFSFWNFKTVPAILLTLEILASIIFVIIVYHYVHDLKKKKCECSVDLARDILEIINYVQLFMMIFAFIIMIHAMVLFSKLTDSTLKSKSKKLSKSK